MTGAIWVLLMTGGVAALLAAVFDSLRQQHY